MGSGEPGAVQGPAAGARWSRDTVFICLAGALRAAATSLAGVLIAIFLAERGFSASAIGLVLGVGIASNALGTIATGIRADSWGRRRTLTVLGLLAAITYVGVAVAATLPVLLLVAAVGMLNGMGRDRGPASALEQAVIPSTVVASRRTWAMAWYNVAIDSGHAVGALGVALPTAIERLFGTTISGGHAWTFVLCGAVLLFSTIPYSLLSLQVEASAAHEGRTVASAVSLSPDTRKVVRRLAALFGVDSIGGGFLSSALVAYWLFERFGATEVQLAGLFFAARLLNVVSHLAAAHIAGRIGLLNTMVLTHLPSSLFLMFAPAAPSFSVAAALFLAREALVEMDVPTRQSYVMAVVPPEARTYASGMTNVTRTAGWAVGPLVGGTLMQHVSMAAPLFIGGSLKILYDLLLYRSFRNLHPPEEARA